ncbi:MAG: hypothetical protein AB7O59_06060 [Pirellulales bacterium]
MPRVMTIAGMVVAALLLLLFGLDLAVQFPFRRAVPIMDILFIVCAGVLGYMSWSTFREQA